jgi:hypothetical protein
MKSNSGQFGEAVDRELKFSKRGFQNPTQTVGSSGQN